MKPFLRWEINLYLNYLKRTPFDVERVASIANNLISLQIDITVDEFRKLVKADAPHPDGGAGLNRGAAFLHAANVSDAADDDFPTGLLAACRSSIEAENNAKVIGQLTQQQLAALYPELWAATGG